MTYHLDYETRSRADLKKVGAFRYAFDPSTEILCAAIARGDEEPLIWVPDGAASSVKAETLLYEISANPDVLVYAHNAMFEIAISTALWEKTFRCSPPRLEQWRCTLAMARKAALPVSLDKCSETLGLSHKKDHRGAALIRKFSIPQKGTGEFTNPQDDPEAFQQFCEYCLQDVRVEREIHKKLRAFELDGVSLDSFHLTNRINARGFPVNIQALEKAKLLVEKETERLSAEFRKLTGINPTQRARVLEWLREHGYTENNLQSATLEEFFETAEFDIATPLGQALDIRKQLSFTSLAKIPSMIACAGPHDNRVRGTLVWHGTGPGRLAAALVQPQNIKRPTIKGTQDAYRDLIEGAHADDLSLCYGPPLETISSCTRHFIDDNGAGFFNADYSAIQARTVCWLAGEESALQEYRNGVDRYCSMASVLYGYPVSKKTHEFPERFVGKQIVLGCGFGMGSQKFRATCEKLGYKELPKGMEAKAVKTYRETHPNVVQFWKALEDAARNAINCPNRTFRAGAHISMRTTKTAGMLYLLIRLPSGREIAYPQPQLEPQLRWREKTGEQEFPDGSKEPIYTQYTRLNFTSSHVNQARRIDPEARISDTISFFGQIPGKASWGRITTYSGKLAENVTMGVEADMMNYGLRVAEDRGYEIASIIHDEALAYIKPGQTIQEFEECLTTKPSWAAGLPVISEGSVIPFYKK